MRKPLLWASPVFSRAGSSTWFDLLDMRGRTPIFDLTRGVSLEIDMGRDLQGMFGLGLFGAERGTRCCGVKFGFAGEFKWLQPGDRLQLSYVLTSLALPNNRILTGRHLQKLMTPTVQRAIATAMGEHVVTKVRPASELPT